MTIYLPIKYRIGVYHALLTGKTAWQWIDWKVVMYSVRSLQSRIVKAVNVGCCADQKRYECLSRVLGN